MKAKSIWVIYGGNSSEREVSLNTGKNVLKALMDKGFDAQGFDLKDPAQLLEIFKNQKPDLVFLGLHGTLGEDGRVQGFLDSLKVPYVGSGVLSSALCFNKLYTQKILKSYGIRIASFFELHQESFSMEKLMKTIPDLLSKKRFIKAASQGSTIGIFRFDPKDYLDNERKEAFEDLCYKAFKFDKQVLVEDWIEGRELTVSVVFGETYPVIEIKPNSKFYDYKSKYTQGQSEYLCPAPLDEALTKEIQDISLKVYQFMDCQDYARVDFMLEESTPYVLEVNTLPGMTATSLVPKAAAAKGLSFEDFIEHLVNGSYSRQKK